jgi:drug/metabolite transporter (DMT)-like permease
MNPGRGIALKVASTFVFTLMLACVKAVADRIPAGEIVFCRSFFALIPVVLMLLWQGELATSLRTAKPWVHLSRGAVGVGSMALSFSALAFLPLPESMMIGYAAPLIVVILAAFLLGETVRLFRWTAVTVGLVGIVIILWPRLTVFRSGDIADAALIGALLALASAILSAFASIFVRTMTRTESTGTIVIYFALVASLLSLVVSLPFGWVMPAPADAALLVACGLLGGVGQILMTAAYRSADTATIASFEYVSMLWGVSLGYIFFREAPTGSVLYGGAIVVAAGIFIIFRERQLGLQRKRQRKAAPPAPR